MNAHTINLVCSVVALLAGTAIFGWYWLERRRIASEATDSEVRNYSIYIEGEKIGTCQEAALFLDVDETQLTFAQIVPTIAPHYRKLKRAFCNGERMSVAIGPIDESIVQLGMMRVDSLALDTDMQCGGTWLEATLSGLTLAQPIELKVAVANPNPEDVAAVFSDIERRAAKVRENITNAPF
jgi:hypothetical protein